MTDTLLRMRKRLTTWSLIVIARCVWLLSFIVPYRLGVSAGAFFGYFAYFALVRERRRTIEHLKVAFRDKDAHWIRRTAQHCFIHLGKSLFEAMLISPRRLAAVIDTTGSENLRSALSLGKGVIFVTGHIGNWEILGGAVAAMHDLSVVAAPIVPESLNDMILGLRSRIGIRTILRGRPGAAKELIRVFKENRVLGLLIDQDTDVDSAFVDFMGKPAWTPTAAASMALKFDAPVVFGYIRRLKNNKHKVIIEGPLTLKRSNNMDHDIMENTAMLTKKIEACISETPEQWVWMHRRWRRQP
jgi:Kdo2-lipid IVA lauroyltransferase/acyltransferase